MEQITDQAVAAAGGYFGRRIAAIRAAIAGAADIAAAQAALVELAAKWTPDALATLLGDAMELARWHGREAVFLDEDDAPAAFAFEAVRQSFREQVDFLRQKRVKPTNGWLDAMHGDHDRAFVVAGVTDTAMLEEFQAALISAAENGGRVEDFAKDFDRLVEKYGWEYKGERNWRIRTIFETNMRTSFMAGRLKQMRDPDVVKLRPYWQYLHGDRRTPRVPRPVHLGWNNQVLMWNDPWWDVHFPPNDWLCSCGVRTLSKRDLERLGKSGPDETPREAKAPLMVHGVGLVNQPVGVGYGWDYMPGDLWERGLVPSELTADAKNRLPEGGRHVVSIDQAAPIGDLFAASVPFKQKPLAPDLSAETYLAAFRKVFEDHPRFQAPFWEDQVGHRLVISDEIFRDRQGVLKLHVGDRGVLAPLLAETIIDPDEIWLGVRALELPGGIKEYLMTRRYIRLDQETGIFAAFDLGRKYWSAVTGFRPAKSYDPAKAVKTNWSYLNHERVGKLLWKRKRQP